MQKRCQRLIAAKSHDINGLCLQNRGNGGFKGRRIQIVYGILDLSISALSTEVRISDWELLPYLASIF